MNICKWHRGKLIILWSWAGLLAGLALTYFLMTPVLVSPVFHLISFCIALFFPATLSVLNWIWLTGREQS
jgi:hypothetical protein